MRENVKPERVRIEAPAGTPSHENVPRYVFTVKNITEAGDPVTPEMAAAMEQYGKLQVDIDYLGQLLKSHAGPVEEKEKLVALRLGLIEEKQRLHLILEKYLGERRRNLFHHTVLSNSLGISRGKNDGGKDSEVRYKGTKRDFLANPNTPRYVHKQSVEAKDAKPVNVKYLIQKYKLLRELMGEHIPRAAFVYGEVRDGLSKSDGTFDISTRALTLQREIRGKTFAEMTPEERQRPEVQAALAEGLKKYNAARDELANACRAVGVPVIDFQMGLDIGPASPDSDEHHTYDPLTFSSPNVMFDERPGVQKIEFIDMGWGEWDEDKQKVFDYIMAKHAEAKKQKTAA